MHLTVPVSDAVPFIIIIIFWFVLFFFLISFSRYIYICVHYRLVRFSYCIGDKFIEPYGFSDSLPLLSYYV